MPRTLPRLPRAVYRDRSKYAHLYEPVASVPEGLRWKPATGSSNSDKNVTVLLSTPGSFYKLIRDRVTGEVVYFKMKDTGAEKSPADKIDTEGPTSQKQVRYRTGGFCWFVDTGSRWYCCEVVERKQDPARIVLRPVTGWDAERQVQWSYGDLLEFPALKNNPVFCRLRPLKARSR